MQAPQKYGVAFGQQCAPEHVVFAPHVALLHPPQ
jgi:hypothetical protein